MSGSLILSSSLMVSSRLMFSSSLMHRVARRRHPQLFWTPFEPRSLQLKRNKTKADPEESAAHSPAENSQPNESLHPNKVFQTQHYGEISYDEHFFLNSSLTRARSGRAGGSQSPKHSWHVLYWRGDGRGDGQGSPIWRHLIPV